MSLGDTDATTTYNGKRITVSVDIDEVIIGASDSDLIDYVVDELDHDEILKKMNINLEDDPSYVNKDILMEYLVTEYHRGAFSEFDFKIFFKKINKSS